MGGDILKNILKTFKTISAFIRGLGLMWNICWLSQHRIPYGPFGLGADLEKMSNYWADCFSNNIASLINLGENNIVNKCYQKYEEMSSISTWFVSDLETFIGV